MGTINSRETNSKVFTLRKATPEDLEFLFNVSTEAMRPVVEILNPGKVFDRETEFVKYKDKFDPGKIEIIQYKSTDVGRLRVVRSAESIYIGGIQILPEFQGKGIGTALFAELIEESKKTNTPIVLEVHNVNELANTFYKKLGFAESGREENKIILKYVPKLIYF